MKVESSKSKVDCIKVKVESFKAKVESIKVKVESSKAKVEISQRNVEQNACKVEHPFNIGRNAIKKPTPTSFAKIGSFLLCICIRSCCVS